ncbi:MAG: amylo-alpha-1,6-glucosidase [Nitrososphaerales archaeon]
MQTIFDSTVTKNYEQGKKKEWVVTNGLGSYASSTVIGLNTRAYHGLLIASLDPPVKRVLFLSKMEEQIDIGGREYLLAVNRYPGTIYPQGFIHIEQFRFERYPVFVYRLGNTIIEKSIFMPFEENSTIITYKVLESDYPIKITISPIVNYRDYHGRTHEDQRWNFSQTLNPKGVEIRAFSGATTLYLQSDIATYQTTGSWYKNFVYDEEAERGLEDREDQYNPGYFTARLDAGSQLSFLASLAKRETFSPEGLKYREMHRLRSVLSKVPQTDPFYIALANAADTFIVKRKSTNAKSIIAGYHWFADWGRDAMISIPGLTLVTKREEEAKEIIRTFLSYMSEGLIPNTFPESGSSEEPLYSSIDASLWLLNSCYLLYFETGTIDFIKEIYPKLKEIITSYSNGTKHNIRMDSDGLIAGGEENLALTWMDAMIDGIPVTPRVGKPVEISALWYNGLKAMMIFAKQLAYERDENHFKDLASRAKDSFNGKFWNERKSCLDDLLVDERGDGKIRPNQIFAIGLPFPVLQNERWRDVLRTVEAELLTPLGLRTLSPFDPEYKARCAGSPRERDSAYHQGTVWPWLFGSYVSSYLKTYGNDPKTISFIQQLYGPFKRRMTEAGVATISEVFDADAPHLPRGCISQAWSVAEILRSYVRDANQS